MILSNFWINKFKSKENEKGRVKALCYLFLYNLYKQFTERIRVILQALLLNPSSFEIKRK